jgi:hypothetical protein
MVDRSDHSDHILLIHPCPRTLYLCPRASEIWRTPVGKQPVGLLE